MQGVAPQNRHLISLTEHFLSVHWDGKSPLLLGYSGGPDSKALLYTLLDCGIKELHVAHVDHGWREESQKEALLLQEEAAQLGCPFHTTRLQPVLSGNQEDAARQGRLAFFSSLFLKTPYQALLLAHQAEDLAETVLKRVFEGAHLPFLGGMASVGTLSGMVVWRPFLQSRRKEIQSYLEERGLKAFIDPTNADSAYLRARMREEILPFLKDLFGKEIIANLNLLSERALELKSYLDQKTQSVPIRKGPWGFFIDLNGLHRIERRHLLQKLAKKADVAFPRSCLETILDWIENGEEGKSLLVKKRKFTVDGRVVFCDLFNYNLL